MELDRIESNHWALGFGTILIQLRAADAADASRTEQVHRFAIG